MSLNMRSSFKSIDIFPVDVVEREATARGFRAIQYNLVVSTNEGVIRLWKKHGFEVIGTLQNASSIRWLE